jgi:hypothetical protein
MEREVFTARLSRCNAEQSRIDEGNWFYAVGGSSWSGFKIVILVPLIVIHWSQKLPAHLDFASKLTEASTEREQR